MPIYEFKCPKCGNQFDKLQKYSDKPPQCAKCKAKTKRLISAASFNISGGGVYKEGFSGKK